MTTDTPRTDAVANGTPLTDMASTTWGTSNFRERAGSFARRLERENARLRAALESVVAHYDMGGVDGPYANPDATAWCIDKARAALVQS